MKIFEKILLLLIYSTGAHGLYFPVSELEFTLPLNLPSASPLLDIRALRENDSLPSDSPLSLSVDPPEGIDLFSSNSTASLLLFSRPPGLDANGLLERTLRLEARPSNGSDVTPDVMLVSVTLTEGADCRTLAQELCFWTRAKYQVLENRPSVFLGSLGPAYVTALCPGWSRNYTLLEGGDYASVHSADSEWSLWSQPGLDREATGDMVTLRLACTLIEEAGSPSVRHFEKAMTLIVRDENDNPPLPLKETVDIYLENPYVTKGQRLDVGNLVLRDADWSPEKTYDVSLLGDTQSLLYSRCTVSKDSADGQQHALITCKLRARKSGHLVLPTPYVVHLKVIDSDMIQGHGAAHGIITIRLHADNSPPPPPLALPLSAHPPVVYPSEVAVLRTAAPFGRLVQPTETPANELRFSLLSTDGHIWRAHIFNITTVGGILFVNNVRKLRHSPNNLSVTLTVVWQVPGDPATRHSAEVKVNVIDSTSAKGCNSTIDKQMSVHNWPFCSEMEEWKSCEALCGLGTPGGRGCQWRGKKKLEPRYPPTQNYSTCTPDLVTCPDRKCDPLEDLHPLLCPQDCTKRPALLAIDPSPKRDDFRGIYMAPGVCICTRHEQCNCVAPNKKYPKSSSKVATDTINSTLSNDLDNMTLIHTDGILYPAKKEVSALGESRAEITADIASDGRLCGPTCLVAILAFGCFLLLATVGGFIYLTWRRSAKGRRDLKFVGSVGSLSGVPTDYARSVQGSQLLTYDHATIPTATQDHRLLPDPKWEFSRSQLVIEQTLGEGEFGRVLRARATNIGGYPGVTTVAVKTLKEDASSVELVDLLSEYQLLKEVSHPNVIKLLGACTQPVSQPVYIIIEFAQHGSLRNYLRKSRHLESEGRIPCSFEPSSSLPGPSTSMSDLDEPIMRPCTPRDILSYAWQIAKGMSYLSDIKLVHRDLAARNVLVAAGGVCKVSDFGLTRDIYEDDAYLKRSKGKVPVKWMALESLGDHIYTSKSDVWSFGVLLWELVTLGASPYPGVAVHNLFHLLKAGYRMEKPENCSSHLYEVMQGCWQQHPADRPTFHDLTLIFERMLEDGIEYLDLNPRIVHNRGYFASPSEPSSRWTNPLLFTSRHHHRASGSGGGGGGTSPGRLVKYATISRSATQLFHSSDETDVRLNSPITPETLQLFHYSTICGSESPEVRTMTVVGASRFQRPPRGDRQHLLASPSARTPDSDPGDVGGDGGTTGKTPAVHAYENERPEATGEPAGGGDSCSSSYLSPIRSTERTQSGGTDGYTYTGVSAEEIEASELEA